MLLLVPILYGCQESQSSYETIAVETNNGVQWKANTETTAGISNMQSILSNFEGKKMTSEEKVELRNKLENEFMNIFNACTMEGAAHDQLHNFLMPMTDIMEDISNENTKVSKTAVRELKQHLSTYTNYFE